MKVLNLRCSHEHSFEGWFGSEEDFQSQLGRGLIECPLCADKSIQKMPSAPRLNLGGHTAPVVASANQASSAQSPANVLTTQESHGTQLPPTADLPDGILAAAQAAFLKAVRHVLTHTEDVGQSFADEARRMHYGEVEARSIRGQASARETVDLLEEGIEVMPLPMLPMLKETLQ